MDKFWKILEKSTIISGVIAFAMVGTACYCTIAQIPLPDHFAMAFGAVIAAFFTSKMKDAQMAK